MDAADESRKGLRSLKRFITTHDDTGKPNFVDTMSEDVPFQTLPDNVDFALCYATDKFPVNLSGEQDVDTYKQYTKELPGIAIPTGTVLRVVDMPPGATSPMHRTISLDYGVVLEGEVELRLDSGEKRLMGRGDMSIQRGTNHEWRNASITTWARMLYVLQPAEPFVVGGKELTDNTKHTIPGYEDK
ncbi:hypothetical protein CC79DRAFT_1388061 [Sarocladium strictum]